MVVSKLRMDGAADIRSSSDITSYSSEMFDLLNIGISTMATTYHNIFSRKKAAEYRHVIPRYHPKQRQGKNLPMLFEETQSRGHQKHPNPNQNALCIGLKPSLS